MSHDYSQLMSADLMLTQSTLADTLGIPLNNRFVCVLNPPKAVFSYNTGVNAHLMNKLRFQVISSDVPNFQLDPVTQELNGVNRYYFKGRTDSDLTITYLEDAKLGLRNLFFDWMNLAVKISANGVERGYLNEYVADDIIIAPLDRLGRAHRGDRFIKPFPFAISNVEYNKSSNNEIIKTTVTFKYVYHELTDFT